MEKVVAFERMHRRRPEIFDGRIADWVGQHSGDEFTLDDALAGIFGLAPVDAGQSFRTIVGIRLRALGCRRFECRLESPRWRYLPPEGH